MRTHRSLFALALALAAGTATAADLKSGPQAGKDVPGPFAPLNINGDKAGEKSCLYCSNGNRPVAMIFAREKTPALTRLIKEIEGLNGKAGDKMGSFVVFLSDNDSLEKDLKKMAEAEKLSRCVLSIDSPAGPKGYNVARDADVTVVLYKERKVQNNWAFKKGELKDEHAAKVVAAMKKIVD